MNGNPRAIDNARERNKSIKVGNQRRKTKYTNKNGKKRKTMNKIDLR
jgi:hypothetical protein